MKKCKHKDIVTMGTKYKGKWDVMVCLKCKERLVSIPMDEFLDIFKTFKAVIK